MEKLIAWAVERRVVMYFLCMLFVVGGLGSYLTLGQLEDPVFSVKKASIITQYPGASPEEVELEVTDRLEKALQEMVQLDNIYSTSRAGLSIIKADIKEQYWSDRLPQVWDEMRNKIDNVVPSLPPGTKKPIVGDDYGFVYGFLIALTGDEGFSYKDLEDYAEAVRKELSVVSGVSRVEFWGVQPKVVYLDVSDRIVKSLNITAETIQSTLANQNVVVDAGALDEGSNRFRIDPSGEFKAPTEIGELVLRPQAQDVIDTIRNGLQGPVTDFKALAESLKKEQENLIRVKDVADVKRGYLDPPQNLMYFDGKPAIGIAIAGQDDSNIVKVGAALDERLKKLNEQLPIGIEVHKIAWQSDLVSEAIGGFFISLAEAVLIVLIVLTIPSGFRMGFIVGIGLLLTILGTFVVMGMMKIPFERMSLGALIIALGMMVDNTIVVSDGIAVNMRRGMSRVDAAIKAATSPALALLSATLIAIMAFYPIYGSQADAGEYCRTLFIVVAASLLLSWFIALFITPLHCIDFLPEPSEDEGNEDEFDKPLFRFFRKILKFTLNRRALTMAIACGLLVSSILGFGLVRQMFFPESTRPQLMVDFWAPYGTRIQDVAKEMKKLEMAFNDEEVVQSVATFVGGGPPRFYLPVESEDPYQNFGQMILSFDSFRSIDPFIEKYGPLINQKYPLALVRLRKFSVGPGDSWKFQLRVTGPAEADLQILRDVAEEIREIGAESIYGRDFRLDVQNRVLKVVPEYDQKRGRWAGVERSDLANATKRSYDGLPVGLYREGRDMYPIIWRSVKNERENLASNIGVVPIKPSLSTTTVPISQVTTDIKTEWEEPIIARWNRRRAITVEGDVMPGETFPSLYKDVIERINQVELPPGYELVWQGEKDSSAKAQAALVPGLIPAVILILLLLVLTFNSLQHMIIIMLTIPFAVIGITLGLLVFNMPFGFLALLGAMSLSGMMIKNIIVLLDAVTDNLAAGMERKEAIIEAAITRVRPVLLAAGTTILGVVPLLTDVFWQSMAVTIMAGLAVGSLLTLIIVPVMYAIVFRLR